MDKKEIEFEFERATKNTYRFLEKSSVEPLIGTLYVQKAIGRRKQPENLKP